VTSAEAHHAQPPVPRRSAGADLERHQSAVLTRPLRGLAGSGAHRAALAAPRPVRFLALPPGWPLVGLLLGYPLWWALGLNTLIFPMAALPMAVILARNSLRGRRLKVPPGFALWLVFLLVVVLGIAVLGSNPPGTVPATFTARLLPASFRIVEYASMTVILLYAGNLTEDELPRRRLVGLLGWLFLVTVAGGLLGVFAGGLSFSSPLELVLPAHLRHNSWVQTLVHPAAAQMSGVLGHETPRPAAPWGYTNTWGNNFCLLVGWFLVTVLGYPTRLRTRLLALLCLAAAVLPVIYSLNRGLWIGLGVAAVVVGVRLAVRGRIGALLGVGLLVAVLGGVVAATPLGQTISNRLDNGKSNGVRYYLTVHAVTGLAGSPVIGYGSTRNTQGGRQSITVGQSQDCPRCGNFTIGGNGQLWQVIYAHGAAGTLAFLGFFLYGLWRFRRDRSAIGLAGTTAIICSLVASLWYNALVTPLCFVLLAYALLWRNSTIPPALPEVPDPRAGDRAVAHPLPGNSPGPQSQAGSRPLPKEAV